MANDISWGNETSTSFVVYAENLRTNYGEKEIAWYLDGEIIYRYTLIEDVESDEVEFQNLAPDTEYSVYYGIVYVDGGAYDEYSDTIYPSTAAEEENTEWTISEKDSWGTISSVTNASYYFNEYDVVRIEVIFSQSGMATFYSEGASDSRGYLSESTDFDAESGRPSTRLEYDSNTSGDFSFTCDIEAGTTYYFFVRHRYEDSSGSFDVYIEPPNSSSDYPPPTTSDTELTYVVENGSAAVMIDNLNPEYTDVFLVKWTVTCLDTGDVILSTEMRSDEDSLYYFISFDVTEGYQYQVYVEVHGYPDWIGIDVETWTNNIYITADVTGDATWKVYHIKDLTNISETRSCDLDLGVGHVDLITMTFQTSGTATFYSEGTSDNDVIAYLSLDDGFDTSQGWPINTEASNDDDNGNRQFRFTYEVAAGTEYFLWVRCYNSTSSGSVTVFIEPPVSSSERPDRFEWEYPKEKGKPFILPYDEWCSLLDHINEIREYKGLQPMQSGTAVGYFYYPEENGEIFTATMYNQALMGIAGILNDGYSENEVQSGWPVTADCLNLLVEMINSVE